MFFLFLFFFIFFFNYFFILVFVSMMLSLLFFFFSFVMVKGTVKDESYGSMSKYECSYGEINSTFDFFSLQFFIVALSFMLFDMEIVLIMPFLFMSAMSIYSVVLVILFLSLLMLGLYYEMQVGVLVK